jgi:4-amino-4-deoxy-L-arabinose transferase-like glycosyltransferase
MNIPSYAVYIFPFATMIFIGWWFYEYVKSQPLKRKRFEWVVKGPEKLLDFSERGRMSKRDILPMIMITLAAGIIAFVNIGDRVAPQTFFTIDENGIVIDLGRETGLNAVFYYTGGNHGGDHTEHYTLELSTDGVEYKEQSWKMSQKHSETFQWVYSSLDIEEGEKTRYVRISAKDEILEMGELCLIAEENGQTFVITPASFGEARTLFDEQNLMPPLSIGRTHLNGSYFDEIYHARAARELLEGLNIYEITHPPLGKLIIAIGVELFGMTPFGWRFMGTLFGILMLPLMYLLLKQFFNSTFISVCGTLIWTADFMRFAQTRIATIDTYNVFFVLLMFIFMHRWLTLPKEIPFLKTLPPLFMCGLAFGLGAASKWSAIYAGFGLVVIYAINLYRRRERTKFIIGTLAASLIFFIAIPVVVYTASYIPYVQDGLTLGKLWRTMIENQIYMYWYHSEGVLSATHHFASNWYMWVANTFPMNYYHTRNADYTTVTAIVAFINPMLAWGGLLATVLCMIDIFLKKSLNALFIIVAYLTVLLPWVPVDRLTFAYHYFPASMFLVLALCYIFKKFVDNDPELAKKRIAGFTVVAALLFAMFYPILSGIEIPRWYAQNFLNWLPSWKIM